MSDIDSETGEAPELDLSNSDVVTKYKAAAEIANKAIAAVIADIKDGAKILDLCQLGDSLIVKEVNNIFKGKQIEKGIAFPTCLSVNSVVGHFSPTAEDTTTISDGDVVKIDLGVHIDGFVATQAQTVVVQATSEPITGRAADLLAATRTAFDAALRLIRPGKHVSDVAGVLQKVVEAYDCNLVEGVMSHQMKQFVIDANKCVLNKPTPEAKVEDNEFEENEVYAVDIVVSTGEGKPKVVDERETTVYKRALDVEYNLRLKASRAVLSEVTRNFPAMPFSVRALQNVAAEKEVGKQLRLGLVECLNHGLLSPYPVLHEKAGELVAHIKGTVLLMPNGSDKVTTAPQQDIKSEKSVTDEEVVALLATSLRPKKKNKKKAGKGAAAAEAPAS